MSDPTPYDEDVKRTLATFLWLGKEVWILFEDAIVWDKFYRGDITECSITRKNDGTNSVEHFVEFDDGDEGWFNLKELEEKGLLRWTKPSARVYEPRL